MEISPTAIHHSSLFPFRAKLIIQGEAKESCDACWKKLCSSYKCDFDDL
jgi:hypothetical protein